MRLKYMISWDEKQTLIHDISRFWKCAFLTLFTANKCKQSRYFCWKLNWKFASKPQNYRIWILAKTDDSQKVAYFQVQLYGTLWYEILYIKIHTVFNASTSDKHSHKYISHKSKLYFVWIGSGVEEAGEETKFLTHSLFHYMKLYNLQKCGRSKGRIYLYFRRKTK